MATELVKNDRPYAGWRVVRVGALLFFAHEHATQRVLQDARPIDVRYLDPGADVVVVLIAAGAPAEDQRERIGQLDAPGTVDALLLDLVLAVGTRAARLDAVTGTSSFTAGFCSFTSNTAGSGRPAEVSS